MKTCLIFSLLASIVIIIYLCVFLDGFTCNNCDSSGKRTTAKRISQVSNLDDDLINDVATNMELESFANCDSNGYPVTQDILFPDWDAATIARLQRTMANDDPLHHYLDSVQLYSKIVRDKIVVKLAALLNFRNLNSLIMDFTQAKLVRTMQFNLEISDGNSAPRIIERIDHNCTAPELVVKNGQLLFILLPAPTNLRKNYKLTWTVMLNGSRFELMTRTVQY